MNAHLPRIPHNASGSPPDAGLGDVTVVDRLALLDALLTMSEPDTLAVMYPKRDGEPGPGWIKGHEDCERAIRAYRDGTLSCERFDSITKENDTYLIHDAERLAVVLHRDGMVAVFCVDLDDHTNDGGNAGLLPLLGRFFGAAPVVFASKGGKGYHCFFRLKHPVDAKAFVKWAKSWGFNRQGQPEVFPKSAKLSPIWLPNEPNEQGGDAYVSGSFETWTVSVLPAAPAVRLTNATLEFLHGFLRQPGRNDALNKAAFELGQKRMARAEAERLCLDGARRCGLADEDPSAAIATFESGYVAGIESVPEGDAALETIPRRLDGIGNGERFASQHGDDMRFCYERSAWFFWDGTRWSLDAAAEVEARAKSSARSILDEMAMAVQLARDQGERDADVEKLERDYRRHARESASVRRIKEMLHLAQSEPGIRVPLSDLDASPMLLNVTNGTLDLTSGTLRGHERRDLLTKRVSVEFDINAHAPRWTTFLERVFEGDRDVIEFIQRAVGYSLTGDVGEQCLFFALGSGQNGKSVFMHVLLSLLGEYGSRMPADLIMKQVRSSKGSPTPYLVQLCGARLAVTSELEEGQALGEAQVKDLTGGDRIVGRGMYASPIEFDPTHKLWIYGNHKPTIRGTDDGIWRRIRLIPFLATIGEDERDPHLLQKLKGELPGILAWAVRGCLDWQQGGLRPPSVVMNATQGYRTESDHLAAFIEECCVVDASAVCAKGAFSAVYRAWCGRTGEVPLRSQDLRPSMFSRGFGDTRTNCQRVWTGLTLIQEGDSHDRGDTGDGR